MSNDRKVFGWTRRLSKGGRHASYISLFFPFTRLFTFTKTTIQRDGLLPCWKIVGKCAFMHVLGKCACTYRENVHMCTYRENVHISLKQPGKRWLQWESLTFRCDRLSPAGQVCNTFMWAFNFHNAFHKLPFASLQKDFFNLGFDNIGFRFLLRQGSVHYCPWTFPTTHWG